jgi:hypothetical protein
MCVNSIRDKVIKQIDLITKVQNLANINIVNCGSCGAVVLHERFKDDDYVSEIECPYCHYRSEPCDFPDFLYTGMENSTEFDETEESLLERRFLDWVDSDNVVKSHDHYYKTQCSQYRISFTFGELRKYFYKEYKLN